MKGEGKKKEELVKELVELHERVAELEKSETGRKQAEKELKAANQQLTASEQQLRAANQQLTASEQQLRAANQQLTASEQQLRETNNYLESLINYANAPIIVWDPESKISQFNHAFEHLTGYKADEVIGQELSMLFPEASRDESLHNIARTLSGKYWKRVEIPILCKDGEVRLVLWNSANIYAEDGKTLLSIIAQGQDITDYKQAEEALKESEEKYRTLVEHANDWIWTLDKDGNFTFVNKAAERESGYKFKKRKDKSFVPIIVPEDLYRVQEVFAKTLKGEGQTYDVRIYDSRGKILMLEVNTVPIKKGEEIVGTVSFGRDITERKRVEEEAKYQRNYFQALFEDSPEGIVSLDEQFRVVDINTAFKNIFGYALEEIKAKNLDNYILPKKLEKEGRILSKKVINGEVVAMESVRKRKDGREIPVSILGAPIFIDGKEVGIFAIYRDITERKEAEEKLKKAYKEVKRALEQEKVFKLKTAHYFFNPLCIAKGYIDLTMEELPEGQREKLKAARHAIERVEKVVENVTQRGEIRE